MALERWELVQRQKGNKIGAEMAQLLRKHFGDVPLPTSETLPSIKKFSPETKEALEKLGYLIYSLTGKSIKNLKEEGMEFRRIWRRDYPDFEALTSIRSEVAINPDELFLPKSNYKTLKRQEEMVDEFSEELTKKIQGVKAVIGQAPDYLELAFQHLDKTKDYLFGEKYHYDSARTKTPTRGSYIASIGGSGYGWRGNSWSAGLGHFGVYAAPLVVPV